MLEKLLTSNDAALWLKKRVRGTLYADSRFVRPGDAFLAWPGRTHDGRTFVMHALDVGASAALVEDSGVQTFDFDDPRIASFSGLRLAAGDIAASFFGQPSQHLQVIAVTGTNGKTSACWWLAEALERSGTRCGVIGTLGVGVPGKTTTLGLTTPEATSLQEKLRNFVDLGFDACALEASSIGLVEQRLRACDIHFALFTNLTHDHLDYHGTMQAYWEAKRRLFRWPGLQGVAVNVDDEHGRSLACNLKGLDVWTVSCRGGARLAARARCYTDDSLIFDLCEGSSRMRVRAPIIGDFQLSNLVVVLGGLRAMGIPLEAAVAAVSAVSAVPGRMQLLRAGGISLVIDYAHTPSALVAALHASRRLAGESRGSIWCVFGCGGGRDRQKRPRMGAIAARFADHVIVTSDNSRNERPADIISDILADLAGRTEITVIEDRSAAIVYSVNNAVPGDVILIAGKGNEEYQEVLGVRMPYSDEVVARFALERIAGDGKCRPAPVSYRN